MKSGNLNFLEPSGPLQAGNGADCFTLYVNKHNNEKITGANKTRAKDQKKYGTLFLCNKSNQMHQFPKFTPA
jgi:hypothetical protein